jgi:hypothetical protein
MNMMETCTTNTQGPDRWRSGSSNPTVVLTIPFRITKGKSVVYLARKHAGLVGQEVGKTDPAAGVPYPTATEATKVPEGGAGETRLSDGAEAERPNPLQLRHEVSRCEVDSPLRRPDPMTAPGDTRGRAGAIRRP